MATNSKSTTVDVCARVVKHMISQMPIF